jgi:hypothetical protein
MHVCGALSKLREEKEKEREGGKKGEEGRERD